MRKNNIKDIIAEQYAEIEDVLFADGFDDAIIGFEPNLWKVVYSRQKCIETLIQEGESWEDSVEYLEFNTFNAFVGDKTPLFVDELKDY